MNIVILDAKTLGEDISLEPFHTLGNLTSYPTTNAEQTQERIKNADIVITNKVVIDANHIDASNIKLICVTATGTNNIDMDYAKEKGIVVKNAVGYSTQSVIQHTFSMLLYLIEQMKYYDGFVKDSSWSNSGLFTNVSRPFFEISGKKWGIIGLGEIGRGVANVATSFGAEVSYYSTSGKNHDQPYKRVKLDELLSTCDIISIHSPLNPQTLNLINKDKLNLLKDDAVLLNLGRGGIVNENDLVEVLQTKPLYVGLDVTEKEPLPKDSKLHLLQQNDKVCITPHIAWTSVEARKKLMDITYENVVSFLEA